LGGVTTEGHPEKIKPVALITGASRGIGWDLAHVFAQDGYDLVVVARTRKSLEELAGELQNKFRTRVTILIKDLTDPRAPEEIHRELSEQKVRVDVLVNNAGFASYGKFHQIDLKKELDLLQVNVVALTHLTKLFLRDMVAAGKGRILNLASTAAFQPGPLMAVYYASKAYVLHFSEAIANELKGTGVTVTALCPGPTKTGFVSAAKMEKSGLFKNLSVMDSMTVARAGYEGMKRGKTVVIPGWNNKLIAQLNRIGPREWVAQSVRMIQSKRH
jgi:short-subunit dehydrogenase